MAEHRGNTNEVTEVQLTSSIEQVLWTRPVAAPGALVRLEVFTHYVGNGAPAEITLSDAQGSRHGTLRAQVAGNRLVQTVTVPQRAQQALVAEVKLPQHGNLTKQSPALLVTPPVEITNLQWSQEEARRGDVLTLSAEVRGAYEGTEAEVTIWEHDADGAHDLVTRLPVMVEGERVEAEWGFEYQEDTDDIPTEAEAARGYAAPEYFFRVAVNGVAADSGLLQFKDWIEIRLRSYTGAETYRLHLPDGSVREGSFDAEGVLREEGIPPGSYRIEVINPNSGS